MVYRSCFRDGLFQGKVALVTGGATGIGYAIAKELAYLGATVVIAGRDEAKCHAAVQQLQAQGIGTAAGGGDDTSSSSSTSLRGMVIAGPSTNIRDADQVAALVSFCVQTCRALDILVNNAGGQFISPASALSKRGFAAVVETNLTGTFLVSQQAYEQYMADHGGSIVNITIVNNNGLPGMSHSGAARAGVENLTKSLALEWMESGVRVNCVRPGVIWTESGFAAYGEAGEEFLARILPAIPAKRLGTPQEVSNAVIWLLSEGSNYVTGTSVLVDGGLAFSMMPLIDIPEKQNLPVYAGELPRKARL